MSATLQAFADACDRAAATTKKLEKQRILADYFLTLPDDDLPRAVRYADGRPFPRTQERVLGVSGATIRDVALALYRVDYAALRSATIARGEMGEAVADLFRPIQSTAPPLELADLATAFDELAATGKAETKQQIVTGLLQRCRSGREVAYLVKVILGDLRTGVREGVLQDAVAKAFDKTGAEVRRAQLLLGDLDRVAVLAKHDRLSSAAFTLFAPLQSMLATPVDSPEEAEAAITPKEQIADGAVESPHAHHAWIAEQKLDGIRAQLHKQQDRIAIYSRTMDRVEESFPEVLEQLRALRGDWLLDGEVIAWKDDRALPFAHLQKRLGRKNPSRSTIERHPCRFIAFDLLYHDGTLYLDEPLSDRRATLEALAVKHSSLYLLPIERVTTAAEIAAAFDRSRHAGNEGLMLKDPASCYAPGKRGQAWLKLKGHLPTLDCVVTYAERGHGKRRDSLSDYTFALWNKDPAEPDAELLNIGKAYSGVTDAEIAQLTELFLSISLDDDGRKHRVEPRIVLEIAFDTVQQSRRHDSGYALRFPRIKRIRWDKSPADADRLSTLVDIFNSVQNLGKNDAVEPPAARQLTLFD